MMKITKGGILLETKDGEKLFQGIGAFGDSAEMALTDLVHWVGNTNKINEVGKKLEVEGLPGCYAMQTTEDEILIHQNGEDYRLQNTNILEQIKKDLIEQKDEYCKEGLEPGEFFLKDYKENIIQFKNDIEQIDSYIRQSKRESSQA